MKTLSQHTLRLFLLGLLLSLALGIGTLNAAWNTPPGGTTPPENNTDAPLNVATGVQTKAGGLQMSSLDVVSSFTLGGIPNTSVSGPYLIDMEAADEAVPENGIRFPDGSVQVSAAGGVQGLSFDEYMHIQHRTASGYTVPSGWNIRPLNTTITNSLSGASLASNQITLPSGTYYIEANVNGYSTHAQQSAIYNATAGAFMLYGVMGWGNGGGSDQSGDTSIVSGVFTLASQSQIEVRFGAYSDGLCFRTDTSIPGSNAANNVCTDVKIWKLD